MNWFQRYGIPGTYFCGILILWIAALYHGEFDRIINSDKVYDIAKIIGAIAVASFLPIGYLISVIGQIIYHCIPGIGIDRRARKEANAESECHSNMEWKQEIITISQIIESATKEIELNKARFTLEWMSKRMDMIVINSSLILSSLLSFGSALFLPRILGWEQQVDKQWLWIASFIGGMVFVICFISWWILSTQLAGVEAKVLFRAPSGKSQNNAVR